MGKRDRLINTAIELAHKNGINNISIADIAQSANVPVGNVYYYFKKKDQLVEAVIESRFNDYKQLLEGWESQKAPKKRIEAFIDMTLNNSQSLSHHGCPVGGLCMDLRKVDAALAPRAALIFKKIIEWLTSQFQELEVSRAKAERYAIHVLSSVEGAALLSQTFKDKTYIEKETKNLRHWLNQQFN